MGALLKVIAVLALATPLVADRLGPGDHTRVLNVGGRTRNYLVHVPPQYDPQMPMPLVLAFHGGGSNAELMIALSGLNDKADQAGFIVVYPNGLGQLRNVLTFNAGNCCGYAMTNRSDDVELTREILSDVSRAVKYDKKRVFATGMSNGGMMAYRLASELSDKIAAIASVAGPMGTKTCQPRRPVSVLHFHGSADEFAPVKGGKGIGPSGTEFLSVDHSIQAWVAANGCQAQPTVTTIPDTAGDGTTITRQVYGGGRDDSEVVLVTIEQGGHTWPGREARLKTLGKSTQNISATDLMWEFFEKHPMK